MSWRRTWFTVVAAIMAAVGAVFAWFGFEVIPVIPHAALQPWSSAIYGSMMIGWALTLLWIGRLGFERGDATLLRGVLFGLGTWLGLELAFSIYLGVWFNVGVDVAVFVLFAIPTVAQIRRPRQPGGQHQDGPAP